MTFRRYSMRSRHLALVLTIALPLLAFCPMLSAAGRPFSGTFKDERISVTLQGDNLADSAVHGTITSLGKTYPLTGHVRDGKLDGTFTDNTGNSFPFSATIDGMQLSFATGQTTYHLAANPLDDGAPSSPPAAAETPRAVPTTVAAPGPGPAAMDGLTGINARMPWLHEGAVLTFATNILATNQLLKPDRDGGLTDPDTGRHFKPGDREGTSASGLTQDAITAIDGEKAVVFCNFFADERLLGARDPVVPISGFALASPLVGGNDGDAWIDPARLASMKSQPAIGVLVTPITWKAGERTIDAVRLSIVTDKSCTDCVYELKTGLELHYFQCSQTRPGTVVGKLGSDEKNWFATWGDLVSVRDLQVPWAGEAMPDWVASLKSLHYGGALIVHGPFARPQPYTFDVTRQASGKNWAFTQNTTLMQGISIPSKAPMIYGNSQFGGIWAGPAALAKLQQSQVLDEDPLTHVKTVVKKAGGDSVIISRTNDKSVMDFEYNAHTGMLESFDIYDGMTHMEYATKLQGKE